MKESMTSPKRLAKVLVVVLGLSSPGWSATEEAVAPAARPLEREAVPAELRLPERGRKGRDRYGDALPKRAIARLGSERFRVLDPGMNVQLRFKGHRLELVSRVRHRVTVRDVGRAGAMTTLPGSASAESFALSGDRQRTVLGCGRGQRVGGHTLTVPNEAAPRSSSGIGVLGKSYMRTCAAFDAAANTVVTVRDERPRTHLWNAKTGEHLRALPEARCDQLDVAMAPDGAQLACTTPTGVEVWNAAGERVAQHEGVRASAVAYAEDGRTLAVGLGKRVEVYDAKTQERLASFAVPRALDAVAVTADRTFVAGAMRGEVGVWQLSSGRPVPVPAGHSDWVTGLAFSGDGRRLYSAGRDGAVFEWHAGSGELVRSLLHAGAPLASLSASADGQVVAALSDDKADPYRLFVLDAVGDARVRELEGKDSLGRSWRGYDVVVAADGSAALVSTRGNLTLRALTADGEDREVSLPSGIQAERLAATPTLSHAAAAARMSTSHPVLVDVGSSRSKRLRLPRTKQRARSEPFDGHEAGVSGLAFSPDGSRLATAARGGNVYLWNVDDGSFLGCFQGRASALTFDASGKRLVLGTEDGGVSVVEARPAKASLHGKCTAPKNVQRYEGHFGPVEAIEVSPDGRRIASGARDGMVLVWQAPR